MNNLKKLYLGRYVLKKMYFLYFLNFIIYHLCAVVYQIVFFDDTTCTTGSTSFNNDLPYYIYALVVALMEVRMMWELHVIVGAPAIYNFFSFSSLFMIYSSQMGKYDLYTDIQFVTRTYFCTNLNALYISYASIVVLSANLLFNWIYFISAYSKAWINMKDKKYEYTHNFLTASTTPP